MRTLAWAIVVFLAWPATAQACRCATDAPFEEASQAKPIIVRARVLAHGDVTGGIATSMTLGIAQVLKGEVRGPRMKVWGDPGNLCRPYVSRFPVGTEWIFAIDHRSAISICGVHWLRVEAGGAPR